MRRILHLTAGTTVAAAFATAILFAAVQGTKHDLSNPTSPNVDKAATEDQICVFCHTPHNSITKTGVAVAPLWNHTLSGTATYNVYDSPTLDASIANGGDIADINQGTGVSNLCMSCHDGTVGVNDSGTGLITWADVAGGETDATGKIISMANLGSDLSNDHPINFTYDSALATADGELNTPVSANWVDADPGGFIPLFGGTMQCASCHDPHDNTNSHFLVVDNAGSNLCTQCHQK